MIANYHTHTWRCHHARGAEREYVEQAIQAGVRTLGFSDHTPCPFSNGYVSYFRMLPAEADDYFRTVTDLKKEYAGQIDIRVGVEAEFYPAHFEAMLRLLENYPCEYLLMGQHFIENEYDGVYSGSRTAEEHVLVRYVSQVLEGLSTGRFTYLAHPDLLNWHGDGAVYEREMERLCRGVKAMEIPLEINLLGLYEGRHYPVRQFWQIAARVGNRVILGCDAHQPEAMNRPDVEAEARRFAADLGIALLNTVELRPII